jgi:hypothetical protein
MPGLENADGESKFMGKVDLLLPPDDSGFREGNPSGEAHMRGWFRLPDTEAASTIE